MSKLRLDTMLRCSSPSPILKNPNRQFRFLCMSFTMMTGAPSIGSRVPVLDFARTLGTRRLSRKCHLFSRRTISQHDPQVSLKTVVLRINEAVGVVIGTPASTCGSILFSTSVSVRNRPPISISFVLVVVSCRSSITLGLLIHRVSVTPPVDR